MLVNALEIKPRQIVPALRVLPQLQQRARLRGYIWKLVRNIVFVNSQVLYGLALAN